MKVGELFLDLGVQGSEKTLGLITGVKGGLQSTASEGLAAKAAIVGAMYALQSLFSTSNKAGTDLTNFNSVLGVSAQTLQQYQYAARQVGVSNEEVAGSFSGLQQAMGKILLGKAGPSGLAEVARLTGDLDPRDVKLFAEDPSKLILKLQEYAQKEKNVWLRNETLKSFGVGDGMIAAMSRNAFTPKALAAAPRYSDGEIKNLDKVNAAWSNLGTKIEMSIGRFNAKHGGELIKNIDNITTKVLGLAEAFVKVAEKLQIFETIGKVFEGWGMILTEFGNIADDFEAGKGPQKSVLGVTADVVWKDSKDTAKSFWENYSESVMSNFKPDKKGKLPWIIPEDPITATKRMINVFTSPPINTRQLPAAQPTSQPAPVTNTTTNNITQNQTFTHDGTDPVKARTSQRNSVRDAFRQIPAATQGN